MGLKEAVWFALEEAGKQKQLVENTDLSRQTYYDVLNDKQKKGPTWITILAMTKGIDKHRFAHLAFDLPEPEDMLEIEGSLKTICDLVLDLDENERREIIGYIRRMNEEGGESHEIAWAPEARHG